jgi:methionyl-tRNA synthetase
VQTFLQTIYDAGDIELGTYEGLYCVSCEAYYAEDELVDGCCPIHLRPVEHVVEENYFFKLSRFTDRLLAHFAKHPDAVQPESRMNEVLRFIRGGLQDFSMSRTSIDWGVPLPWDPARVTCGSTRCSTTAAQSGTAPIPSGSTAIGRSTITSSAKTSSGSTRCTGPRC